MSKQKLIDVIQWILIIGLSIVLLIGFIRQNEAFTKNAEYERIIHMSRFMKVKT